MSVMSSALRFGTCGLRLGMWDVPPDPLAHAAAHDPGLVVLAEPVELLGEERHGLAPRARQARPVGAPEHPLRAERVIDAANVRMQIAERVWQRRVTRQR